MNIFHKLIHSVVLTTNIGVVLGMIVCGNVYLLKPEHSSFASFLSYGYVPFFAVNLFFLFYWGARLRPWIFLSIAGIVLTWSSMRAWIPVNLSKEKNPVESITVLTYNVEYFQHNSDIGSEELSPIVNYIQQIDADIVCLQEAGPFFVQNRRTEPKIRKALKAYKYFSSGEQENRYSVVVLSKFRILESHRIEYTSKSNSSFYYDIKVGKDTVRLINNHLESNKLNPKEKDRYSELIRKHESNEISAVAEVLGSKVGNATVIRARQADSVSSTIRKSPHNVLLCGDFNDVPGSYTYRKIRTGLQDAWVTNGTGWGNTFHEHFFLFRIDYILYCPAFECLEVKRAKVDFSDHYPLWAKFRLL
jgi:endonuclease/exonuclease/phosphatase family metal-dependent hydrolase